MLCCRGPASRSSQQEAEPAGCEAAPSQTVLHHGPWEPGRATPRDPWAAALAGPHQQGSALPFDVAQLQYLPRPPGPMPGLAPASASAPAISSPSSCATYGSSTGGGTCTMGSLTGWQVLAADVCTASMAASAAAPPTSFPAYRETVGSPCCRRDSALPASFSGQARGQASFGGALLDEHPPPGLASRYQLLDQLGRGAFGAVFRARRRADSAPVCVKVLPGGDWGGSDGMAQQEARVLSALRHPNIVACYDALAEGGATYIVMELCQGGDLEQYIKEQGGVPLPEADVMRCFVQLCLALHHAHSKGIVHRDIKPSNMLRALSPAAAAACAAWAGPPPLLVKLGDFGVARALGGAEGACARTLVGTPYYLAPELVQDIPYDWKADVWSAGCVLYELAALRRPFSGNSVPAVVVKILRGTVPALPAAYSGALHALVGVLLDRDPRTRPSVEQVLAFPYVRRHVELYCAEMRSFSAAVQLAGSPAAGAVRGSPGVAPTAGKPVQQGAGAGAGEAQEALARPPAVVCKPITTKPPAPGPQPWPAHPGRAAPGIVPRLDSPASILGGLGASSASITAGQQGTASQTALDSGAAPGSSNGGSAEWERSQGGSSGQAAEEVEVGIKALEGLQGSVPCLLGQLGQVLATPPGPEPVPRQREERRRAAAQCCVEEMMESA